MILIQYHLISALKNEGLLKGIQIGKNWIFREEDIHEFWNEYLQEELPNPEAIRTVKALHRTKKTNG